MKKIIKIAALAALALGLIYNLQVALNGYASDIAYAAEDATATTGTADGVTTAHLSCSIQLNGTANSSATWHGFTVHFDTYGHATLTASNAAQTCQMGGKETSCKPISCGDFWNGNA